VQSEQFIQSIVRSDNFLVDDQTTGRAYIYLERCTK